MKLKYSLLTVGIASLAIILTSCKKADSTATSSGAEASGAKDSSLSYIEIAPEWPSEEFAGTPVPLDADIPNLEEPKEDTEISIPEDSNEVAAGKPVTSSVEPIIGDLSLITDGDASASDGCYIEIMDPGVQWIQIDIEEEKNIHGIVFWHYHKEQRVYHDVVIQVSSDPEFTEATTVFNNDYDNSAQLGEGEDPSYIGSRFGRIVEIPQGVKGRYVRFYSSGNTSNNTKNWIEVKIYARDAS